MSAASPASRRRRVGCGAGPGCRRRRPMAQGAFSSMIAAAAADCEAVTGFARLGRRVTAGRPGRSPGFRGCFHGMRWYGRGHRDRDRDGRGTEEFLLSVQPGAGLGAVASAKISLAGPLRWPGRRPKSCAACGSWWQVTEFRVQQRVKSLPARPRSSRPAAGSGCKPLSLSIVEARHP
jgi:hypothetical protein